MLREIRLRARKIAPPVLAACVVAYFGYHALHGERGVPAWRELKGDLAQARASEARLAEDRAQLARRVGLLRPDSLDPDLTVFQNLVSYGRYFNLPSDVGRRRATEALELFQLAERSHHKPDELSGGMRRRLLIARALLHEPNILVLDEPTTGLDPQTRLLVWERLVELKARGITILLTTHYMEEAAYLCDRLVVMDRGSILVEGPPKDLIRSHVGENVLEMQVSLSEKQAVVSALSERGFDFEDRGDSLFFYGNQVNGLEEDTAFADYQLVRRPANLEDVFLRLTGRGLREE